MTESSILSSHTLASSVPKVEKNNLDGKRVCIIAADGNEERISSITSMIEEKGGQVTLEDTGDIDLFIHGTGNVPNFPKLTELSRDEWDKLVNQFINTPAMITQSALDTFVPGGSDDPRKFKDAEGKNCNYWSCSSCWQKN